LQHESRELPKGYIVVPAIVADMGAGRTPTRSAKPMMQARLYCIALYEGIATLAVVFATVREVAKLERS
jgi:hypothetical protein